MTLHDYQETIRRIEWFLDDANRLVAEAHQTTGQQHLKKLNCALTELAVAVDLLHRCQNIIKRYRDALQ